MESNLTHFDVIWLSVQHMEFDVDKLMNLGMRLQSATQWLEKALGNYFGNITEVISFSNTKGKRQTTQSLLQAALATRKWSHSCRKL